MITEKTFALSHSSFWQELLPSCERFVRRMNMALSRFGEPLEVLSPPTMRGIVNELGMRLVAAARKEGLGCEQLHFSQVASCVQEAVAFIRRFRAWSSGEMVDVSPEGIEEAKSLALWLEEFFITYTDGTLSMFPALSGFGWLDDCNCDAWTNDTIFEVKSGDRAFRSADVRQLVTYLALNHLSGGRQIKTVFLVNPRRATYFRIGAMALSQEIAGCGVVELYHEIEMFLLEPIVHHPSR